MKKILLYCLIFTILFSGTSVFAKTSPSSSNSDIKNFFISIYDDTTSEFIIPNKELLAQDNSTVIDALTQLKTEKLIVDFHTAEGELDSIAIVSGENGFSKVKQSHDDFLFLIKRNGITLANNLDEEMIEKADIIEIIYTSNSDVIENGAEIKPSISSVISEKVWTETDNEVLNSATDWMNQNGKDSSFYLISLGIAGKTADSQKVNSYTEDVIKKVKLESSADYAKAVLSLTFCGFDADSDKYSKLITKLSTYENIFSIGVFGGINTLNAYDCNKYDVAENSMNSRKRLVESILVYQNSDGGFSINISGESDIDTTAMAITALSTYREQPEVQTSIDRAIEFLLANQTENGGFGYKQNENCESLATVIIALNSIGISDDKFIKNGKTLLDNLNEYRKTDGGFSHIKGEKSTQMPTQQAIIAMSSIKKGGNPYILTNPIAHSEKKAVKQSEIIPKEVSYVLSGIIAVFVLVCLFVLLRIQSSKKKNKQ